MLVTSFATSVLRLSPLRLPWLTGKISIFHPRLAGNNIRAVYEQKDVQVLERICQLIVNLAQPSLPITAGSMTTLRFVIHASGSDIILIVY